ncbi:hypothetical protein BOTBODRAFT_548182 [Botryobasidium botryosum FD-172 SS1]|uniref:Uncharacterized protein n=1 Tax=Botryobasidium botryosum (strain FD-172 SS1) TaxID=930990 RepID=A0A067MR39_BOTB1|nr:hypothetical protein BOTBODRAFT_548182 [Botryobasidium botryosum FD-172 SS1]
MGKTLILDACLLCLRYSDPPRVFNPPPWRGVLYTCTTRRRCSPLHGTSGYLRTPNARPAVASLYSRKGGSKKQTSSKDTLLEIQGIQNPEPSDPKAPPSALLNLLNLCTHLRRVVVSGAR